MTNPITNFIRSVREVGFKETWKKLNYNYAMLNTPQQLLKKEIIGYLGAMFGTLLALVFLIIKGNWYISVPVGFTILIMYAQFKGKLKQLTILNNMEREVERQMKEDMKDVKE